MSEHRLQLRMAALEDVGALAALEHELFGADAWCETTLADEVVAGRVVVAVDGDLVGYATSRTTGDLTDLTRIAVVPECRGQGVARALMAEAVRRGAAEGADRMLLEVSAENQGALTFYAREGFVEIDRRRRYYRDGSDALVLRLALGPVCGGR